MQVQSYCRRQIYGTRDLKTCESVQRLRLDLSSHSQNKAKGVQANTEAYLVEPRPTIQYAMTSLNKYCKQENDVSKVPSA